MSSTPFPLHSRLSTHTDARLSRHNPIHFPGRSYRKPSALGKAHICFLDPCEKQDSEQDLKQEDLIAAGQLECGNCNSDFHLARMLPHRHAREQTIQLCGSLSEGPLIRIA